MSSNSAIRLMCPWDSTVGRINTPGFTIGRHRQHISQIADLHPFTQKCRSGYNDAITRLQANRLP